MLMFSPRRGYHHNLQSSDGLTVLSRIEIVAILVHYQPYYNTSHTMKPSEPLLLADVALRCGMYPAGKVDISRHLAIRGFPQSNHTVGKSSAGAGSLCSETHCVVKHRRPPDLKSSSNVSLPFAWITGPRKWNQLTRKCICWSLKLEILTQLDKPFLEMDSN